jgi:hypothetical protein
LLVLTFLIAFERRTAFWGCLLGVSAAAASLTMYSGLIALAAVGLAAVLDSDRHAFFRSPAPYCAAAVYLVALMPHGLWLVERDFPSLKWATGQMGGQSVVRQAAVYFLENAGRMALPIAGAAVALWPWRARPAAERAVAGRDARMVLIIAVVLVVLPLVLAFGLSIDLKGDWGFAFFLFVPTALLILFPRLLVTRRAVTAIVTLAAIGMAGLLAAAPVVPLVNFWLKPGFGGHEPISELAAEVTRLWRERYGTPLPVVVSYFDIAAPIVFYSPDHPLMYADFLPAFSPWFDYPEGLRNGFVAVCRADNTACIANANALDPDAERIELALSRTFAGMARQPARFQVRIAGAKS